MSSQTRLPRHLAFLAGLFFFVVSAASATAQDVADILTRSDYSPSEKKEVESLFQHFLEVKIPAALLEPRLQEGISKQVPVRAVLGALRRAAGYLVEARDVLQSVPSGAALVADQGTWALSATLMEGGVSDMAIRRMAEASGGRAEAFRNAIVMYESLSQWGLSEAQALPVTEAILRSRIPSRDYIVVPSLFTEARTLRIPTQRLIDRMLEALPNVRRIEQLRRDIIY